MAEQIGSIYYDLDLDDKKFKRGLSSASGGLDKIKGKFKAAEAGSFALLGAVTAAAAGAVAFGVKSVSAYNDAVQAQTKLRTNMLNVKGATDAQVQSMLELSSKIQAYGVIEDDAITAGMSQLATFNLQSKSIQTLTPKITDMVAQLKGHNATAEDMVGINNLVGKVMTGNVGALSRYGVTLDENQSKVLKNGTESERAAMLVKVLGQNYGEVNKELANTPQGKVTQLKNAFGDLQEGVGELVMRGLTPLVDLFSGFMTQVNEAGGFMAYFQQVLANNQTTFAMIGGVIAVALVPAVLALGAAIWGALAPLLPFIAAGMLLGLLVKSIADKMGGWSNMMAAVKNALSGIFAVVSAVLMPALKSLWTTIATQLWPALQKLWATIAPVLIPTLKVLGVILGAVLLAAIWAVINVLKIQIKIITAVINVFIWLLRTIGSVISGGWNAIKSFWDRVISAFNAIKSAISSVINAFGRIIGGIKGALSGAGEAIMSPFRKAFDWIKEKAEWAKNQLNKLNPFHRESPSLVDYITRGADRITGLYGNMFAALDQMALQNRASMVGATQSLTGAVAGAQGNTLAPTPVVVQLNQSGIVARSRSEFRDIMADGISAVNEDLRARGIPEIGNGKVRGSSTSV